MHTGRRHIWPRRHRLRRSRRLRQAIPGLPARRPRVHLARKHASAASASCCRNASRGLHGTDFKIAAWEIAGPNHANKSPAPERFHHLETVLHPARPPQDRAIPHEPAAIPGCHRLQHKQHGQAICRTHRRKYHPVPGRKQSRLRPAHRYRRRVSHQPQRTTSVPCTWFNHTEDPAGNSPSSAFRATWYQPRPLLGAGQSGRISSRYSLRHVFAHNGQQDLRDRPVERTSIKLDRLSTGGVLESKLRVACSAWRLKPLNESISSCSLAPLQAGPACPP